MNFFSRVKCLEDIKAAFLFEYPAELTYKLYERRGRCFSCLEKSFEAIKAFEEALKMVLSSKLDAKKRETFVLQTKHKIEELNQQNDGKSRKLSQYENDSIQSKKIQFWIFRAFSIAV